MAAWLINRLLPGLATSAIVMGISHIRLKRHVSRVADDQTRAIRGDEEEGGPC